MTSESRTTTGLTTWLFRPSDRIAGGQALISGLILIALTALLASSSGLLNDGVIDLHFGPDLPFWVLLAQGLINWLTLSMLLLIAALWLGRGPFRWIDLFGTQALARWPMLAATAYLAIPGLNSTIRDLTAEMLTKMPTDPSKVMASSAYLLDAMWLTLISLPTLIFIVWMIWLMYHAYAVSTGLKGMRAAFSFTGALILAAILSKVLIVWLLPMPGITGPA
ncbi:MAG: hypothetical protein AAGJ52_12190 [Pseudomonadota bacterium]